MTGIKIDVKIKTIMQLIDDDIKFWKFLLAFIPEEVCLG